MKPIKSIEIIELSFRQSPITQSPFVRPFVMEAKSSHGILAMAQLANTKAGAVTPGDVTRIATDLVSISNPTEQASIVNGFDSFRYSYVLNARVLYRDGSINLIRIKGYTDTDKLYGSRSVNYDIQLYIVNVEVRRQQRSTGGVHRSKLISSDDVILPDTVRGAYQSGGSALDNIKQSWQLQRPDDVFSKMMLQANETEHAVEPLDLTNCLSVSTAKSSTVGNSNPFVYTSRMINGYSQAVDDLEYETDSLLGFMGTTACSGSQANVSDDSMYVNPLLAALRSTDSETRSGVFSIKHIQSIDPSFNKDRIVVYKMKKGEVTDYRNQSTRDNVLTPGDEICANVSMQIQNYMSRIGLLSVKVLITNRTTDSVTPWVVTVVVAIPAVASDKVQQANASRYLENLIRSELCVVLDSRFKKDMVIRVESTSITETVVMVSTWNAMGAEEKFKKVYPTYAASSYSAMLVPPRVETGIVGGFTKIVDMLSVTPPDEEEDFLATEGDTFY